MNRLISVIGPAPSELSWQALREKIQVERNRMREAFDNWNFSIGTKPRRSKKGISLKDIALAAASMEMTVEEMNNLLAGELRKKGDNRNV